MFHVPFKVLQDWWMYNETTSEVIYKEGQATWVFEFYAYVRLSRCL